MSENINPESVRALCKRLRESCGTDAIMASAEAADLIEARERAYLALSERVGELAVELKAALKLDVSDTGVRVSEIAKHLAALSHKGMDHG